MAIQTVTGKHQERVLTHCGTPPALLKNTGIDAYAFPELQTLDATCEAVGGDGLPWVLTSYWPLVHASRPMTVAEIEAEDAEIERRTLADWFGRDRLKMCQRITRELRDITCQMRPDNPPPRAKRRELRQRLDALSQLQWELLTDNYAGSRGFRQRLESLTVSR